MTCAFRLKNSLRVGPGCQFPENVLIKLSNGQTWCRFHLPMTVEGQETAKAQWGEAEIEAFNDDIFAFIATAARVKGGRADLSGVVFPGSISFDRYRGEVNSLPDILFDRASFGGAWFYGASFGGVATFEGASFGATAMFERASFGATAMFKGASFGGEATFQGASFDGHATFQGASFGATAMFERASFGATAMFERASFSGDARFQAASFGGVATFEGASFARRAVFSSTGGETDRAAAIFSIVNFVGAQFSGEVLFHNRKFVHVTDFRRAYFECAPKFHGCTLHQDTFFPKQANFRDRGGAEAGLAYRTLKHAMASVHARGEEAKFYVLEQKSLLRDKDTPRSTRFFSVLYWLAADYGQSVLRPLFGALVTSAAFFAVYVAFLLIYLDATSTFVFPTIDLWDLLRFSLRQVFRPFEVFSWDAEPAEAVHEVLLAPPLPLALLAALHSLLTFSFLALFLLAMRRRFKLD